MQHSAIAFDLQGHRGARGLAPENTLAASRTALSIGVTTLELDVGMSKDGVAGRPSRHLAQSRHHARPRRNIPGQRGPASVR